MLTNKEKLIKDIENLLNNYDSIHSTTINPAMLSFLDEATLISIIGSLLTQKEDNKESDTEWLEQFKKEN